MGNFFIQIKEIEYDVEINVGGTYLLVDYANNSIICEWESFYKMEQHCKKNGWRLIREYTKLNKERY